jgi:hypothetical protein
MSRALDGICVSVCRDKNREIWSLNWSRAVEWSCVSRKSRDMKFEFEQSIGMDLCVIKIERDGVWIRVDHLNGFVHQCVARIERDEVWIWAEHYNEFVCQCVTRIERDEVCVWAEHLNGFVCHENIEKLSLNSSRALEWICVSVCRNNR